MDIIANGVKGRFPSVIEGNGMKCDRCYWRRRGTEFCILPGECINVFGEPQQRDEDSKKQTPSPCRNAEMNEEGGE